MPCKKKPGQRKRPLLGRFKAWRQRVLHPESLLPIFAAPLCALIMLCVLTALYIAIPGLRSDYWQGVYVESTGFLFDLLFFGVALAIILNWQNRKQTVIRYQAEIGPSG